MSRLSSSEDERRRAAYEQAATDRDAARLLGLPYRLFYQWRNSRGLVIKNPHSAPPLSPAQEEQRRALYREGLTDLEAGKRLGVSLSVIHRWRTRRGLPANHSHHVDAAERRRRLAAYQSTHGDRKAARRLGMTLSAFQDWRQHEKLPPRGAWTGPLSVEERQRRFNAYQRTTTDGHAARLLGITLGAFQAWRLGAGLPAKASRGHRLSPAEEARRHHIYWASPNGAAAARRMGLTYHGYDRWRRTRELPPRRPPRLPRSIVEARKRALLESRTRREAADRLGVKRSALTEWARRHGIGRSRERRRFRRPPAEPLQRSRAIHESTS